jgi:hypothetical protein
VWNFPLVTVMLVLKKFWILEQFGFLNFQIRDVQPVISGNGG